MFAQFKPTRKGDFTRLSQHFIHWLKQTARAHGFLHFADEECQPLPTNQVPGCRIACIRL